MADSQYWPHANGHGGDESDALAQGRDKPIGEGHPGQAQVQSPPDMQIIKN